MPGHDGGLARSLARPRWRWRGRPRSPCWSPAAPGGIASCAGARGAASALVRCWACARPGPPCLGGRAGPGAAPGGARAPPSRRARLRRPRGAQGAGAAPALAAALLWRMEVALGADVWLSWWGPGQVWSRWSWRPLPAWINVAVILQGLVAQIVSVVVICLVMWVKRKS